MTWEKDVYSTMVQKVGYDSESRELHITWAKGGAGTYLNVPEQLAVDLSNAPSVGSMIITEIKPYYGYRKG